MKSFSSPRQMKRLLCSFISYLSDTTTSVQKNSYVLWKVQRINTYNEDDIRILKQNRPRSYLIFPHSHNWVVLPVVVLLLWPVGICVLKIPIEFLLVEEEQQFPGYSVLCTHNNASWVLIKSVSQSVSLTLAWYLLKCSSRLNLKRYLLWKAPPSTWQEI